MADVLSSASGGAAPGAVPHDGLLVRGHSGLRDGGAAAGGGGPRGQPGAPRRGASVHRSAQSTPQAWHTKRREVKRQVVQYSTWEAKQEAATDLLLAGIPDLHPSREDVALATSAFYDLLKAGSGYAPTAKFRGDVTLVKPSRLRKKAKQLSPDYGLSECCEGKVHIHVVEGLHENFILGKGALECANLVAQQVCTA
ncbi:fatty acid synthase-like [Ixodes scapularis]|uniref:fatty acid synthase-like n=1 Tax=Ixodes scapularis TaxID=6945 RepID=UPI001A9F77D2|nr:fatty acid synthase-like [Ixodes scapularis]